MKTAIDHGARAGIRLESATRHLRNGLTLIAVRNRGVETFACQIALRGGRLEERAGEAGLAYLTGTCLEESTRRRSSTELAEAVDALGASMSTGPGGGGVQCPAPEATKAIKLLREAVLEPAFQARDVRRVQQEIVAEIEADDAEPQAVARRRFRSEVYGAHPFARPAYADREAILAYKPADLRQFHRRQFVPHDGVVAASGPLEVEETLDILSRAFRSMRGPAVERPVAIEPTMPARRRDVHVEMDREQVHVYVGHPGVRRSSPDFEALVVMDHVLGSGPGFTSRIPKRLRDEQGLCYAVSASISSSAGEEPGVFTAYIGTSPEHRQKAVDGFLAEIRGIREAPPTADELRDVVDYLTGSYVFGLERNSNLVEFVIRKHRYGLADDWLEGYPARIRAITRDDVQRVAAAHLHPDRVVVVSAGPSA